MGVLGAADGAFGGEVGLGHTAEFFETRAAVGTSVFVEGHTFIMKLRIHADSIRLRLKQSEVAALCAGREVVERCPTQPVAVEYALRPDSQVDGLEVENDGKRLTVLIPMDWLGGWDSDERVGFENSGKPIQLLVEKDFKCANPSFPGDNEDTFDGPTPCS